MKQRVPVKRIADKTLAKRLANGERFIGSSIAPQQGKQSKPQGSFCPIRRKTKIKKKARKPSEFARIYHSKERVTWVKAGGCFMVLGAGDCDGQIDNAHTESGKGTGYKAGYATIVGMCRKHHRAFDEHRAPFALEASREKVREFAAATEKAWQAHLQRGE